MLIFLYFSRYYGVLIVELWELYLVLQLKELILHFFFLLTRLSLKSYPLNIHIYSAWRSWYECLKILKNWAIRWPKQRTTIFSPILQTSVRQAKSKFSSVCLWSYQHNTLLTKKHLCYPKRKTFRDLKSLIHSVGFYLYFLK